MLVAVHLSIGHSNIDDYVLQNYSPIVIYIPDTDVCVLYTCTVDLIAQFQRFINSFQSERNLHKHHPSFSPMFSQSIYACTFAIIPVLPKTKWESILHWPSTLYVTFATLQLPYIYRVCMYVGMYASLCKHTYIHT